MTFLAEIDDLDLHLWAGDVIDRVFRRMKYEVLLTKNSIRKDGMA